MTNIQTIKLGGFLDEEVKKVNDNFAALNEAMPTVPTKVSQFENDVGYQTADQVVNKINAAINDVVVPTKTSDLTNDSGFITENDTAFKNKVDAEAGKGLSTNDYTTEDKNKVAKLGKIDFTVSNFTNASDGFTTATLNAGGKYPVKVMRKSGNDYEEVIVHTKVSGGNIVIVSNETFDGYVVTM